MKYITLIFILFTLFLLSEESATINNSGTITKVDSTKVEKTIDAKLQKAIEKRTPPETTNSSVQCNGKTKKGKRCKKMTKSSNGYCHLHGGN